MFCVLPKIEIGKEKSESNFSTNAMRASTQRNLPLKKLQKSSSSEYHPLSARRLNTDLDCSSSDYSYLIEILKSHFSLFSSAFKKFVKNCSIEDIAPNSIIIFNNTKDIFDAFILQLSMMETSHLRSPSLSSQGKPKGVSATVRRDAIKFSDAWNYLCNMILTITNGGDPPLFTFLCNLFQELSGSLFSFRESTTGVSGSSIAVEAQFNNMIKTIKYIQKTCQKYAIFLEKSDPFLIELGVKTNKLTTEIKKYLLLNASKFSMHSSEFITKKNRCLMIIADITRIIDSILCFGEGSASMENCIVDVTKIYEKVISFMGLTFEAKFSLTEREVKEEDMLPKTPKKLSKPKTDVKKGKSKKVTAELRSKTKLSARRSPAKTSRKRAKTSFAATKTQKTKDNELIVVGNKYLYI